MHAQVTVVDQRLAQRVGDAANAKLHCGFMWHEPTPSTTVRGGGKALDQDSDLLGNALCNLHVSAVKRAFRKRQQIMAAALNHDISPINGHHCAAVHVG